MYKKIVSMIVLISAVAYGQESAQRLLSVGILTSSPQLVKEALDEGVRLDNVYFTNMHDTPLIHATRLYCHTLKDNGGTVQLTMPHIKELTAYAAALFAISFLASRHFYPTAHTLLPSILVASLYYNIALTYNQWPQAISNQAVILSMLIHAYDDVDDHNAEGLTALDVLRAYSRYAYEKRDATWQYFIALLTEKTKTNVVLDEQAAPEDNQKEIN